MKPMTDRFDAKEFLMGYFAWQQELKAVVRLAAMEGFGVPSGTCDPEGENNCVILTAAQCVNMDQEMEIDRCVPVVREVS